MPSEGELADLVGRLDLAAKVRLLTGADLWSLPPEPAVGLGAVTMSDGPQGVRGTGREDDPTGLLAPAPSALGATWDVELADRLGALFAAEARRKGVDLVLAPLANLQRTPVAGRHFEYYAEDPLLTARLAAGVVRGLQGAGVAACVKHFVANDSETDRTRYVSRIDERALREVYLAPFEQVLAEAGPWSVMAAYSGVDDGSESAPMAEHRGLLRRVLKEEWGFDGLVVSDWAATRSTVASAVAGLDVVMPGPEGPWGDALVAAVRDGRVPMDVVDDKVVRLLRLAARVGRLDGRGERPEPVAADPGLLRTIAARSMVVLRDEGGLLPLAAPESVALIGPNAVRPYLQGGGSAFVPARRVVGFEEGLRAALGEGARLSVHRGGDARVRVPFLTAASATAPDGTPGVEARYLAADGGELGTAVRPTGDWGTFGDFPPGTHRVVLRTRVTLAEQGTHRLQFGCAGRHRLTVDGEVVSYEEERGGVEVVLGSTHNRPPVRHRDLVVGDAPVHAEVEADLEVVDAEGYGRFVSAHLRHRPPGPTVQDEIARAVRAAAEADVAVVVVGTNEEVESEGWDRTDLSLPGHQDALVRAVAAANPRTVVVVNAGAPVLLPWADEVPAVLWAWLPGQEAGHALADVLFGRTEPSGRLPWTLPAREEDVPVPHARPVAGVVDYREGPHVGYRAWDRAGREPAFAFGHGLGWTRWHYEEAALERGPGEAWCTLTVRLTNTGPRTGHEVVQVYLTPPQDPSLERPVRLLAGFAMVRARAGETVTATVAVPRRAAEVWDTGAGCWRLPPGRYLLRVGRSSRDARLTRTLDVP
ncbi:glycoside hydrolase family 3 C-terminal domain-containing protein [Streptomyces sp. NPDC001941]|uniref:beta-glucosidase n=1 Tax=Streptomyces sp. NPDC001941 TaxID=3154659 RepID=UPI003323641D